MLIIIFRFFMFVFVIFKEVLRVMEICVVLFVFKFENNYYLVMLLYYKKGIIVIDILFCFMLNVGNIFILVNKYCLNFEIFMIVK